MHALDDLRNGGRRLGRVDGDADELRTRLSECNNLRSRGGGIFRVGVRHGLDHHGRTAPHLNSADVYTYRLFSCR